MYGMARGGGLGGGELSLENCSSALNAPAHTNEGELDCMHRSKHAQDPH